MTILGSDREPEVPPFDNAFVVSDARLLRDCWNELVYLVREIPKASDEPVDYKGTALRILEQEVLSGKLALWFTENGGAEYQISPRYLSGLLHSGARFHHNSYFGNLTLVHGRIETANRDDKFGGAILWVKTSDWGDFVSELKKEPVIPRGPGRPNKSDEAIAIYERRCAEGISLGSTIAEAREIRDELIRRNGGNEEGAIKPETISRRIREYEKRTDK